MEAYAVKDFKHTQVVLQSQQMPPVPTLRADEVLIKVRGATISMFDLHKHEKADKVLIRECSGHVIQVGTSVMQWKIGDKVCALVNMRGYAEEVVVTSEFVLGAPPNIPLVYAAALPMATCVSYYAIIKCLNLRERDILVIHDAIFCLTFYASKRAKWDGLRVFVVTDSDLLADWYKDAGCADVCINRFKEDFVEKIRSLSGMKGANALLISHGRRGDIPVEYSRCLAKNGVILLANNCDHKRMKNPDPPQVVVEEEVSLGSTFARFKVYDIESLMASMDKKTLGSLVREAKPWPARFGFIRYVTMPPSEITTALEQMKQGRFRKLILANKEEEFSLSSEFMSALRSINAWLANKFTWFQILLETY